MPAENPGDLITVAVMLVIVALPVGAPDRFGHRL